MPEEVVKLTEAEVLAKRKQIIKWEQEIETMREQVCSELRELRKRCPHTKTTYHPDPSGNNDSGYSCDLCGMYSRRGWP